MAHHLWWVSLRSKTKKQIEIKLLAYYYNEFLLNLNPINSQHNFSLSLIPIITWPFPIFWLTNQTPINRILVTVFYFFNYYLTCSTIMIITPLEPKRISFSSILIDWEFLKNWIITFLSIWYCSISRYRFEIANYSTQFQFVWWKYD